MTQTGFVEWNLAPLAGMPELKLSSSGGRNGADGNETNGTNRRSEEDGPAEDQSETAVTDDGETEGSDARATLLQVFEELDPEEQEALLELVIQILGGPGAKKK